MKKLISLLVAVVMVASCMVPALAYSHDRMVPAIEEEFEVRVADAMESVYEQLEAQDALDMLDVYEKIVRADIEGQIQQEYGIAPMEDGSLYGYAAMDGGVVTYLQPREWGVVPAQVAITALNRDDSYSLILQHMGGSESFVLSPVIETLLGSIPNKLGVVASTIFTANSVISKMTWQEITACDGRIKVINTYRSIDDSYASVVSGWDTYATIYVPKDATDVHLTKFHT